MENERNQKIQYKIANIKNVNKIINFNFNMRIVETALKSNLSMI